MCLIQHTSDLEDLACLHVKITEDRLAIFISTECKQAANCLRSELRDTAGCVVVVGAGKKKEGAKDEANSLGILHNTPGHCHICVEFISLAALALALTLSEVQPGAVSSSSCDIFNLETNILGTAGVLSRVKPDARPCNPSIWRYKSIISPLCGESSDIFGAQVCRKCAETEVYY